MTKIVLKEWKPEAEVRDCENCVHRDLRGWMEPCVKCSPVFSHWEPQNELR